MIIFTSIIKAVISAAAVLTLPFILLPVVLLFFYILSSGLPWVIMFVVLTISFIIIQYPDK